LCHSRDLQFFGTMQNKLAEPHHKCDLCADNWLFILGAGGRTGSTTAMSMFNSVPSFEISGEHWGLLHQEQMVFQRLKETEERQKSPAWAGHRVDTHHLACNVQRLTKAVIFGQDFETLSEHTEVLGFKEIRYTTIRMLRFLARVFPCARYVFTYRVDRKTDVNAWGFSDNLKQDWERQAKLAKSVHDTFKNTTAMLGLEKLDTDRFNRVLIDKLGVKGCHFTRVLHDNADGTYKNDPTKDQTVTAGACDFSNVNFRLSEEQIQENEQKWDELEKEIHPWQQSTTSFY